MSKTFSCPQCGAPLDYDGGPDWTIECPYCKSSAVVPEELRVGRTHAGAPGEVLGSALGEVARLAGPLAEVARLIRSGRKIEAVKLYRQTFNTTLQEAKVAVDKIERGEPLTITDVTVGPIAAGEPVVMTDAAVEPFVLASVDQGVSQIRRTLAAPVAIIIAVAAFIGVLLLALHAIAVLPPSPAATPTPEFASAVLQFGGEGIGPGWFQDARSIAVDGAGHIYVAEYEGGRVQVFDPTGKFITQWFVGDSETHIYDMTADRGGTIYVVADGTILRVEGATGRLLGELAYPDDQGWFDQVALMPDGDLLALNDRENLVRFDAEGNGTQLLQDVMRSVTGESEPICDLALDGLGNIFLVGVFDPTIFKFAPEGRFVDRFGGRGDAQGQFSTPIDALAVDHQGRIYAADFDGIKVLDATGGYLGMFEVEGAVRAMAFNDQNELFVVTSVQQVTKFRLNRP